MTDLNHLVFSVHALGRMTERDIRVDVVQRILDQDGPTSFDLHGNHRYDGVDGGRRVRVVVDSNNPLFVITAYVIRSTE